MNKNEIFERVKQNIIELFPYLEVEVTYKTTFNEMYMNSIDRTDIILNSIYEFDLNISAISFGTVRNIEDIVEVIYSSLNKV